MRLLKPLSASCAVLVLLASATTPALCQGGDAGGLDLGIGDLGGLIGPGLLGALGGLGGGPAAPAPTIIISQPAMLVHGKSLYIAHMGKVVKLDLYSLEKQAEATYWTPPRGAVISQGAPQGPKLIGNGPPTPKPPLVPGATPAEGP